eukprot:NODE_740_length_4671_cov_0.215879.p1 type:complete len:1078 gc:universal NODE_740_length_4671_cov_0.215879:4442-1209(-)
MTYFNFNDKLNSLVSKIFRNEAEKIASIKDKSLKIKGTLPLTPSASEGLEFISNGASGSKNPSSENSNGGSNQDPSLGDGGARTNLNNSQNDPQPKNRDDSNSPLDVFQSLDAIPSTFAFDVQFVNDSNSCFVLNSDKTSPFNSQKIQFFQIGSTQIRSNDEFNQFLSNKTSDNPECDQFAYYELCNSLISNSNDCPAKPLCYNDCNSLNSKLRNCGLPVQTCSDVHDCIPLYPANVPFYLQWWFLFLILLLITLPCFFVVFRYCNTRKRPLQLHSASTKDSYGSEGLNFNADNLTDSHINTDTNPQNMAELGSNPANSDFPLYTTSPKMLSITELDQSPLKEWDSLSRKPFAIEQLSTVESSYMNEDSAFNDTLVPLPSINYGSEKPGSKQEKAKSETSELKQDQNEEAIQSEQRDLGQGKVPHHELSYPNKNEIVKDETIKSVEEKFIIKQSEHFDSSVPSFAFLSATNSEFNDAMSSKSRKITSRNTSVSYNDFSALPDINIIQATPESHEIAMSSNRSSLAAVKNAILSYDVNDVDSAKHNDSDSIDDESVDSHVAKITYKSSEDSMTINTTGNTGIANPITSPVKALSNNPVEISTLQQQVLLPEYKVNNSRKKSLPLLQLFKKPNMLKYKASFSSGSNPSPSTPTAPVFLRRNHISYHEIVNLHVAFEIENVKVHIRELNNGLYSTIFCGIINKTHMIALNYYFEKNQKLSLELTNLETNHIYKNETTIASLISKQITWEWNDTNITLNVKTNKQYLGTIKFQLHLNFNMSCKLIISSNKLKLKAITCQSIFEFELHDLKIDDVLKLEFVNLGYSLISVHDLLFKNTSRMTLIGSNNDVEFKVVEMELPLKLSSYLSHGLKLNYSVGVDFTWSNKTFLDKDSLHFIGQSKLTVYEQLMKNLGEVIFGYNNEINALGFGSNRINGDCFVLSQNKISSINELLACYREVLRSTAMGGYTNFSPQLKRVGKLARQARGEYYIHFIITDGDMDDYKETREEIINCSNYGISVVVLGVGDGEFSKIKQLLDVNTRRKVLGFYNIGNQTQRPEILGNIAYDITEYLAMMKLAPSDLK